MKNQKNIFSAKKIATLAFFCALSYVVAMISFPIFSATPYLKLDFGNVFILLSGFLFGPVEAIIVCLIKELLSVMNSSSGGIGEIANFLMTTSFVLLPIIVYRFKKGIKAVVFSLIGACFIGTATALVVNRVIVFPLYMKGGAGEVFNSVFWFVLAFNLIKTAAISLLTLLLYKRLSRFLKRISVK